MDGAHVGQGEVSGQTISALMDGELDADVAKREIARVKADAALREHWDSYHLIGDAMRADRWPGRGVTAQGFTERVSERLALEPTVLAPRLRVTRKTQTYALTAAASLAAALVVGWAALNVLQSHAPGAELVRAPAAAQASAVAAMAQGDAAPITQASEPQIAQSSQAVVDQVQEYLLAHQGISPSTAIQGVTPYIRTVSNTGE
ncbi:MAG: anti-sigma 24 factor [Betaproteobacteria bacterium]|nr:anti-sigma 24 factor [Betaproteobacteria bacterium]